LVEGITVVIRCRAILQSYTGGQAKFMADIPNSSIRADGELAAVTFMTPSTARNYVHTLEEHGLKYFDGEQARDLVVVDQRTGLRAPCTWAVFGSTNWNDNDGQLISICQFTPSSVGEVVSPQGWKYEGSLSAQGIYVPADNIPPDLRLLRQEQDRDVFWDEARERELYVYR
jgi:hypothetical protein